MTGGSRYAPFETLLDGYRRQWEHIHEQSPIPLCPLPVCGGWDSRPWHGDNNLVRFGRTPELFRRHLLDARKFLEARQAIAPRGKDEVHESPSLEESTTIRGTRGARPSNPAGLVLIEAWNEWGEGSYIEPHKEFGFGYLDAIRSVFTDASAAHDDLTPADVGLGPYDVPAQTFQAAWDFARDDAGWNNTMDLAGVRTVAGALTGRTTGRDPAFFGPPMQARASAFSAVIVRMKLERVGNRPFTDTAQLFWRTSRLPESEAQSARFPVQADGQWHDYRIAVGENRRWRDVITRLRLDPVNQPQVTVSIEAIRLVP
jgi:hypothetical protein